MGPPTLILVSGPPGAGKTTLAQELARGVGCPALCRDEIKEGMVASHPGFVAAPSDPLTVRTYDLFFAAIQLLLAADVTVVAEAAFQHDLWVRGLSRLSGTFRTRVVRCHAGAEVTRTRVLGRLAKPGSRVAHADAQHLAAAAAFQAIHLAEPTLDVDTSDGYVPDRAAIVKFCRS